MIADYKASTLFIENYRASTHVVINQGGTSSGKTYAIMQVLFCIACETRGQVITVVGQDIPNLKAGPLRDALKIYSDSEQVAACVKLYNKTERIFHFSNETIRDAKPHLRHQAKDTRKRSRRATAPGR